MKISLADKPDNLKVATIVIEKKDYIDDYKSEIKKNIKTTSVPGFRKGKVPKSLIEKQIGKRVKVDLIVKKTIQKFYDYIDENKHQLLLSPSIESYIEMDDKWLSLESKELKVNFCIEPKIPIDLKNITPPTLYKIYATEDAIEKEIKYKAETLSTIDDIEKIEKEEDVLQISYKLFDNKTKQENLDMSIFKIKDLSEDGKELFLNKTKNEKLELTYNEKLSKDYELIFRDKVKIDKDFKLEVNISNLFRTTPRKVDVQMFEISDGIKAKDLEEAKMRLKDIIEFSYQKSTIKEFVFNITSSIIDNVDVVLPKDFIFESVRNKGVKLETEEEENKMIKEIKNRIVMNNIYYKFDLMDTSSLIKEYIIKTQKIYSKQRNQEYKEEEAIKLSNEISDNQNEYHKQALESAIEIKLYELFVKELTPKEEEISIEDYNKMIQEENKEIDKK